jgi:hypothetical protein
MSSTSLAGARDRTNLTSAERRLGCERRAVRSVFVRGMAMGIDGASRDPFEV